MSRGQGSLYPRGHGGGCFLAPLQGLQHAGKRLFFAIRTEGNQKAKLQVPIATEFRLEEAAEAQRPTEQEYVLGKIVLRIC